MNEPNYSGKAARVGGHPAAIVGWSLFVLLALCLLIWSDRDLPSRIFTLGVAVGCLFLSVFVNRKYRRSTR